MHSDSIRQAAEILIAGRLRRARMDPLPVELRPSNEIEAYAVLDAVHAH